MTHRLRGKVAVVTGGASGIGAATAHRLAAEGAQVMVADLDPQLCAGVADFIAGLAVAADVTDEDQVRSLYARTLDTYGSLDITFNNAGICPPEDGSITHTSPEAWNRVQQINLTSIYLCLRHAIHHMNLLGRGSIINNASVAAVLGSTAVPVSYTASKGAILALTRCLGTEYAARGMRVNAVCPGPVRTALLNETIAADPSQAAQRLIQVPMGRAAAPSEIAAAVAFLASDDASFITATALMVDGGLSGAHS